MLPIVSQNNQNMELDELNEQKAGRVIYKVFLPSWKIKPEYNFILSFMYLGSIYTLQMVLRLLITKLFK